MVYPSSFIFMFFNDLLKKSTAPSSPVMLIF